MGIAEALLVIHAAQRYGDVESLRPHFRRRSRTGTGLPLTRDWMCAPQRR